MPDFTVLEGGGRSAIAEPDDPDVLVRFSVRVLECDDASFEFLVHDIEGEITLVDPDGARDPIGEIRAELVNVYDLGFGQALFDAYDSRSDQLTDAFGRLYSAQLVLEAEYSPTCRLPG